MANKSLALELAINISKGDLTLEELNEQLAKAKEELAQIGDEGSEEFIKLANAIAQADETMVKSASTINNVASNTKELNKNLTATEEVIKSTGDGIDVVSTKTLTLAEKIEQTKSKYDSLGKVITQQKDILIEFEEELVKRQAEQASTSKLNYQRQNELEAKIKGLNNAIKDQRISLKKLNSEKSKANTELKKLNKENTDYGKIVRGIDKLTGGMATKFIKLYKGFAEGVKSARLFAKSLSGVQKALVATGIGAIVVALGLIIAYWDDIKGAISGVSSEQKKYLKDLEASRDAEQEKLDAIGKSENSLKLAGKSEKDIRQLKIAQTEEVIKATKAVLVQQKAQKEAQVKAAQRNKNILEGIITFLTAPLSLVLATIDQVTKQLAKIPGSVVKATSLAKDFKSTIAKQFFDPKETAEEADKTIAETEKQLAALQNKKDGFILQDREENKKANEKKREDDAKAAEKSKKAAEDAEKAKQKALEEIRQAGIATEEQKRQEELDKLDKYYQDLIEKAEKYGKSTIELEEARELKKSELFDKFAKEDAEKKLAEQEKVIEQLKFEQEAEELSFQERRAEVARREALLLEDKSLNEEQRNELEKNFAAERKAIDEDEAKNRRDLQMQRLQIAGNVLGALKDLTSAFAKDDEASQRKAFQLNKAFSIGQAILSTATAVTNALTAGGNPVKLATGAQFVEAGIAATAGAAQIATIAKTQFKGSAPSTATPPTLGGGGAGTQPIGFTSPVIDTDVPTTKVIVTETDIRNVSRNVDGVYSRATVVQ